MGDLTEEINEKAVPSSFRVSRKSLNKMEEIGRARGGEKTEN